MGWPGLVVRSDTLPHSRKWSTQRTYSPRHAQSPTTTPMMRQFASRLRTASQKFPVPFATLPFALWLFVHHQPGIKLAATTDNPPPYVALEVNLSDSEIQVSVEPTRSRGTWSDETVRAAHSMGWISDVYTMVEASKGRFGIFTNAGNQVRAVMRWKR